jgi:hypothetical protein
VSSKAWRWVVLLGLLDVVAFVLTLHAHAEFHSQPGGPVTSLGQVLGWIISAGLLIIDVLVILAARQSARYRRWSQQAADQYDQPDHPEPVG